MFPFTSPSLSLQSTSLYPFLNCFFMFSSTILVFLSCPQPPFCPVPGRSLLVTIFSLSIHTCPTMGSNRSLHPASKTQSVQLQVPQPVLNSSRAPNLFNAMFASAITKERQAPCPDRTRTLTWEWWPFLALWQPSGWLAGKSDRQRVWQGEKACLMWNPLGDQEK